MSNTDRADWQDAFRHLDAFAEGYLREENLAGMSVALTTRKRTVHTATYGFADVAARSRVKPETLFEIGSISKSFTAIALLQEHEAGRLDLHAPVTDYPPWFAVKSEFAPITVYHLLAHTGGLPTGSDASPSSPWRCCASATPAPHPERLSTTRTRATRRSASSSSG